MRAFNRFYTERIGALDERHEGLGLTLAQCRCLFTVDRLGAPDIGVVAHTLGLDLGYVSRLLSRLERAGCVQRSTAEGDRRRRVVTLTDAGRDLLAEVARRSNARMDALTGHLGRGETADLLAAMDTIRRLLDPGGEP
jgi:DNA-binding MarR family transcriptional regulator